MTLLQVNGLGVRFKTYNGPVTVVDDLSFEIGEAQVLAVVGESGCGKSVSALAVMNLLGENGQIFKGEVLFEDRDLRKVSAKEYQLLRGGKMAMIYQEPLTSLNPLITVGEQIRETLAAHRAQNFAETKQAALDMIEKVGIPNAGRVYDEYPHSLSGGMRQRIMIAMALICNPRLIIADEPTTALDVTIQAQILELMRQVVADFGASILLVTHDLGVVAEIADKVAVMYAGQIVEEADVFTLFSSPLHPYTEGLMNCTVKIQDDGENLRAIPGVVPIPQEMPPGCRFEPRCEHATERCRNEAPTLESLSNNHKVRCFHSGLNNRLV